MSRLGVVMRAGTGVAQQGPEGVFDLADQCARVVSGECRIVRA